MTCDRCTVGKSMRSTSIESPASSCSNRDASSGKHGVSANGIGIDDDLGGIGSHAPIAATTAWLMIDRHRIEGAGGCASRAGS